MKRLKIFMCGIIALAAFNGLAAQTDSTLSNYYENFTGVEKVDSLNRIANTKSELLSLKDAIIIALQNNQLLKSKKLEINAFQAAALQAGLYPNPEVGVDMENLVGSGIYKGLNVSENTFYITQDFILGGKLDIDRKLQLIGSDLARWELEKERLSVITEVRKSFTVISSLQRQNELNNKLLKISKEFLSNLERRIKAGKVSPAEASRASLISTSLEIRIKNINMRIEAEKANLKAILGNGDLDFGNVEDVCNLNYRIPPKEELENMLFNAPSLARFKTEMEKMKTATELEKAKVTPDLSLSLGVRRLNETGDNALVLGASIPIPIFDDNRGNIQKALIRENQTESLYRNELYRAEAKLKMLLSNITALNSMIEKLEKESLPKAKDAFKIINEGNLAGRFTVLDVLDAQRSLFELEFQYVNAVADYNLNVIELEELTLTKFNFESKARIPENE